MTDEELWPYCEHCGLPEAEALVRCRCPRPTGRHRGADRARLWVVLALVVLAVGLTIAPFLAR